KNPNRKNIGRVELILTPAFKPGRLKPNSEMGFSPEQYQVNLENTVLTTYLEVLNVLDRFNYYNYYWSSYYKGVHANLQLPRVPIIGISYKF
ncbi:MAG TPA: hypothetical protein PKA39_01375, partial [Ignavibacteria bacterium]|nr:hypothetical protein [Ignavibacteria bacterium]